MLITEVILENFMSYEYARIPLKPGVNIICGPNGAGKSSILLGISVALSQSYTERSKRLSDLIRWGKDVGRVTLVLNNAKVKGKRPVPKINKDQIYLTRVLRRDGKYWFEIDNAVASKADVLRLLSRFNVDPENMLIIMHQDMIEQFILLSPQEKLRLIESATGLEAYRRNVLEAQSKLSRVLSEEESLRKMLESIEQTLNYWREQYDRYQEKKQLILKRRFLERELAWAEVVRREDEVEKLKREVEAKKAEINALESLISELEDKTALLKSEVANLKEKRGSLLEEIISLERERAKYMVDISRSGEILSSLEDLLMHAEKDLTDLLRSISKPEVSVNFHSWSTVKDDLVRTVGDFERRLNAIRSKIGEIKDLMEISDVKLANIEVRLLDIKDEMRRAEEEIDRLTDTLVDNKVDLAILNYKRETLLGEINSLDKKLDYMLFSLNEAVKRAEEKGARVATTRSPNEIIEEIRVIDGRLMAMTDISEEVERMYESYSKLYFELKERAKIAAENKEKTLGEIKARMEKWRMVIKDLLRSVDAEYQNILSKIAGVGFVRLINEDDIEEAGIEIHVGFRGSQPIPLNIYSQSGGERSAATMAFLLALQKHIKSPFRAIDEYDVHMDPRNREVFANLIISAIGDESSQYLVITPNQMFFEGKNVHVIVVQNIEGKSLIREVTQ
ncbi:MAG: AAA family ATPase [Candidatus Bathyarchaeia archaeon]|nr:AAA family ATPase [Candidatus Bathyarchaeota archaeon]